MAMTKKYCRNCNKDTWQNPLKMKNSSSTPEYRCVECGHPLRTGGGAKNYGQKIGNKIMFTRTT